MNKALSNRIFNCLTCFFYTLSSIMNSEHSCNLCAFITPDRDFLLSHLVRRHQYDSNFFVNCPYCAKSYKIWRSFKWHLNQEHKFFSKFTNESSIDEPNDNSRIAQTISYENTVQESEAAFLLKLSQRFNLPNNSIQYVVDSTKTLINQHMIKLRSKITEVTDVNTQNIIFDQCRDFFDCSSIFDGLNTVKHLENYYHNLGLYIRPHSIRLGARVRSRMVGNMPTIVEVPSLAYYVPFLPKLAVVLSLPEVVLGRSNRFANDGLMTSILDGNYFKSHPFTVFFGF